MATICPSISEERGVYRKERFMCVFVQAIAGVLMGRSPNVIMSRTETISAVMVVRNVMNMCMAIISIIKPFDCVGVGCICGTSTSSVTVALSSLMIIIHCLSGDMIMSLLTWSLENCGYTL